MTDHSFVVAAEQPDNQAFMLAAMDMWWATTPGVIVVDGADMTPPNLRAIGVGFNEAWQARQFVTDVQAAAVLLGNVGRDPVWANRLDDIARDGDR